MTKKPKSKKTYNPRLIKKGVSYSIVEVTELYSVHQRTVQAWCKSGLNPIDDKRPYLFYSEALRLFLNDRQKKRKNKCKPNEFYCCKCREPRQSLSNEVEVEIVNNNTLNIRGICSVCASIMNRRGSVKKVKEIEKTFNVISIRNVDIVDNHCTSVNTDIREV